VAAALVVAGVLVAVFASREREPEYGAKKLSEWALLLSSTDIRQREESQAAIRHIGTTGVPYLMKWVAYETPHWKQKVHRFIDPKVRRLRPSWDLRDRRAVRAGAAADALMELGPFGEGEIAALAALLCDQNQSEVALTAEAILASFGTTGWAPLIRVLRNDQSPNWLRFRILVDIPYYYRTNALPVIPTLRQMLKDRDPMVRDMAAEALQVIAPKELPADARNGALE